MTKRPHTVVFTLVLAATLMLFPSTARLQEITGPAASVAPANSTHIIIQGDTLWDIANSALRDPFLWPLIWKQWFFKVLFETALTPATYVAVMVLKRIEGLDVYDVETDLNPLGGWS